jgi:hypothetical protein
MGFQDSTSKGDERSSPFFIPFRIHLMQTSQLSLADRSRPRPILRTEMPFRPMLVRIGINKKSPGADRGFNMVKEIVF